MGRLSENDPHDALDIGQIPELQMVMVSMEMMDKPLEGKQAEQIPVITWVGNSRHIS
jgi:hypothetical protein